MIFGKCYFEQPKWFLYGTELKCDNDMKYLGTILSKKYHTHQQEILKASRKAFYAIQGSTICANVVRPEVVSHLWKAMIHPILLHATQSLPLCRTMACFHVLTTLCGYYPYVHYFYVP